jgi:hypothetical protein
MVESTEKMSAASAFARFMALFKSLPANLDVEDVLDQWNAPGGPHQNPTAEQIVTGPPQAASGAGATRMTTHYSDPAPQQGLTASYAEFSAMLKALMTAMRTEARKSTPSVDTFSGRAIMKLFKAKAEIKKAVLAREDGENDVHKSALEDAKNHLASAKRLLKKATEELEETGSDDEDEATSKALAQLRTLTKDLAKAESEDEEDPDEEGKPAKKATIALDDVRQALEGYKVLPQTINGLLNAISGRSVNPIAPIMTKSNAPAMDIHERIETAEEDGMLSEIGGMRAMTLASQLGMVKAGRMSQHDFDCELAKSPAEVKAIFNAA